MGLPKEQNAKISLCLSIGHRTKPSSAPTSVLGYADPRGVVATGLAWGSASPVSVWLAGASASPRRGGVVLVICWPRSLYAPFIEALQNQTVCRIPALSPRPLTLFQTQEFL